MPRFMLGTLCDGEGIVVMFGKCLEVVAPSSVEMGTAARLRSGLEPGRNLTRPSGSNQLPQYDGVGHEQHRRCQAIR